MSRRTSATIILVVSLVASVLADIAVGVGWMSRANQSGWNWTVSLAFLIWGACLVLDKDESR